MSRPAGGGVMVQHVFRTSPAAKAKLQKGDRLTEVDGIALDKPSELVRHIARLKPGMACSISSPAGVATAKA
jgi:S1-C subfamily serine protease